MPLPSRSMSCGRYRHDAPPPAGLPIPASADPRLQPGAARAAARGAVSGDREEERRWDAILARLMQRRATGEAGTPAGPLPPHESSAGASTQIEEIYLPLVEARSLVIAQLGQTLDGRIATCTGHSYFVTGPEDIRHLHRLRALVDAVVVGAGTVIADDPQLTVRQVRGDNPVRVVLDPSGRVPPDRRLFRDRTAPTLWLQGRRAPGRVPAAGVEILRLDEAVPGAGFAPEDVLRALAARGLHRVLVEGGGLTVSRFLAAGALDRLHLTVAPILLGSGRASVTLDAVETLNEALRPQCRHFALGQDILFDLCLRQ
jgi:diaminohydroxyphosphoribosylaminopyrimidine deaminase / 5-amino-6-(5-phosphoribosylamino)uracil reductase